MIRPTTKFMLAFLALTFVMHEAHEIVHTTVGRLICGCWGERDFNVWDLCKGCNEAHPIALLATFAGPAFTFAMIWMGAFWLKPSNPIAKRSLGFALIFANLPFARILTAAMGGGDEAWGIYQLTQDRTLSWVVALLFILLVSGPPLYLAFKAIQNKGRIWWSALFFLVPTVVDLLVVLGGLNKLLTHGVLDRYWILGSPILVTCWTILVGVVLLLTRRHLYRATG